MMLCLFDVFPLLLLALQLSLLLLVPCCTPCLLPPCYPRLQPGFVHPFYSLAHGLPVAFPPCLMIASQPRWKIPDWPNSCRLYMCMEANVQEVCLCCISCAATQENCGVKVIWAKVWPTIAVKTYTSCATVDISLFVQ